MTTIPQTLAEFDAKFGNSDTFQGIRFPDIRDQEIKSYLSVALNRQLDDVREIVRGVKRETKSAGYFSTSLRYKTETTGFNEGADKIITNLESLRV